MVKELGLDPLKDINKMTMGVWGEQPEMSFVMVMRGKFDPVKLFEAAEKQSKTMGDRIAIVSEDKYKLVKITSENETQPPAYFSVADNNTIIAASDPKVAVKVVKAAETGAKPSLSKELSQLVLQQDEKASMFMCGVVGDKISDLPPGINLPNVDPKKLQEQLSNVKSLAVTLRLSEDVALEIAAGMKNEDAATDFGITMASLVDTAKTFLPFAAAQQPMAKPVVDDLVKTLKSDVKKNNVILTIKLSADAIASATEGL
jgi:hypothetical protein